jgi:hypothetical protein
MIISIDKYNVAVIEHDSRYTPGRALEYLYPREDFSTRFGIEVPPAMTSLNYEPERGFFFFTIDGEIHGVKKPEDALIMKEIYEKASEILRITQGLYLGPDYEWNAEQKAYYLPETKVLERQWAKVRAQRTALLQRTDYLMYPDVRRSLSELQISELEAYRQDLRNIPQVYGKPEDVTFPAKPGWIK